jgi:hypothetical protein
MDSDMSSVTAATIMGLLGLSFPILSLSLSLSLRFSFFLCVITNKLTSLECFF